MLKSLAEKKERLMEFLTDEIHRSAFMKMPHRASTFVLLFEAVKV